MSFSKLATRHPACGPLRAAIGPGRVGCRRIRPDRRNPSVDAPRRIDEASRGGREGTVEILDPNRTIVLVPR